MNLIHRPKLVDYKSIRKRLDAIKAQNIINYIQKILDYIR